MVFDILGDWGCGDGTLVSSFEGFAKAIVETQHERAFTLIYRFDLERNNAREFEHAVRLVYHRGNALLLVEEVQEYSTPHALPLWLKKALLTGRHRNLALMFTTQRPGECNKTIISQANHVFCGSLHEKNDLDYARSVLHDRAFELPNLPEREFLYFQPGRPLRRVDNDLREKG